MNLNYLYYFSTFPLRLQHICLIWLWASVFWVWSSFGWCPNHWRTFRLTLSFVWLHGLYESTDTIHTLLKMFQSALQTSITLKHWLTWFSLLSKQTWHSNTDEFVSIFSPNKHSTQTLMNMLQPALQINMTFKHW